MKTFAEMVVANLQEAQQRFASMALPASCERMVGAFVTDACTPRAPKTEWFGTGVKQYAFWQVVSKTGEILHARLSITRKPEFVPGCKCCSGPTLLIHVPNGMPIVIDMQDDLVLPITEKGAIIPIGWHVVEG